jgi:ABC-type oligopeptide transport system substrate-binding subunit
MKKIIALMLSLLMVLSLFAGCSQDPGNTTPSTQESTPAPSTTVSAEPTPAIDQITVGTTSVIEFATRDDYLAATYRFEVGCDANFDLNDGSGWGPDYGDPSTYLGTMLPNYAGYMTKSLGIF